MTKPLEHREKNESPIPDTPKPVPTVATELTEAQSAARRRALAELADYDQEIGL